MSERPESPKENEPSSAQVNYLVDEDDYIPDTIDDVDLTLECDGANDKISARRRVEDLLEERRLKQMTRDFDFDDI